MKCNRPTQESVATSLTSARTHRLEAIISDGDGAGPGGGAGAMGWWLTTPPACSCMRACRED